MSTATSLSCCAALAAALALVPSAAAQLSLTTGRVVPSTPHIEMANGPIEVSDDGMGDQWVAEEPDNSDVVAGAAQALGNGCIRLGRPGVIERPADGTGLPKQIVVRASDPQGNVVYEGLYADGTRWITSPSFASDAAVEFTDPYAILTDQDTGDLYLFAPCATSWVRVPAEPGFTSRVFAGSTAIVVQQGDELLGYSLRSTTPVVRSGLGTMRHRAGTGTARGLLAFEDGAGDLHVFASYAETWIDVPVVDPGGADLVKHGGAVMAVADGDQRLVFVSAITGTTRAVNVSSIAQMDLLGDLRVEDTVIAAADRSEQKLWVYRAVDNVALSTNALLTFGGTGCQSCSPNTLLSDDDWAGFRSPALTLILSGTAPGATWAAVSEPATLLCCSKSATNLLLVTSSTIRAYSSILHRWFALPYTGGFVSAVSADHVGYVRTGTHVIAFSPRTGAFATLGVPSGATVQAGASVLLVRFPGLQFAFGADSLAFRPRPAPVNPTSVFVSDDYALVIEPSATGSRLAVFTRAADAWFETETTAPITSGSAMWLAQRQALLAVGAGTGADLARLSAYSDVSSCRSWPLRREPALRPFTGTGSARFLAEGPPGAVFAWIVGSHRATVPIPLPGFLGTLQVDPAGAAFFAVPIGVFDARGALGFDLGLTGGFRLELYTQSAVVDATGAAFGPLHTYLIQ
jgi:hypothetical protein